MFIASRCIAVPTRIMCPDKDEYEVVDVAINVKNADGSPAESMESGVGPDSLSTNSVAQGGKLLLGADGLLSQYEGVYPSVLGTYRDCPVLTYATCPLGHNVSPRPLAGGPDNNEGVFVLQPQGSYYCVTWDVWGRNIGDDKWTKINTAGRCEGNYQLEWIETADVSVDGVLCVPARRVNHTPDVSTFPQP